MLLLLLLLLLLNRFDLSFRVNLDNKKKVEYLFHTFTDGFSRIRFYNIGTTQFDVDVLIAKE